MRIRKLMSLHRLMDQAGEHGSDGGGTGTGSAGTNVDAAAAAAEAAAAAAAAAAAEATKSKVSDAEAKLIKDAMKHKTRASELEAQLAQATEKLKAVEGIDLDKARTVLAEQEEKERKRLEAQGDYERLTKQMGERHTAEKTTLQAQIEENSRTNNTLKQQIAELTVGNAFSQSKFVLEDLTLTPTKARVIYGSHFEFKDGKVVGYDKPTGASDRTVLVSSTGEPLAFEDAMQKIIEADPDRDQLIRSKMRSGAGSSTSTKSAKAAQTNQSASLTSVDKISAGLRALAKAK